MKKEKLMRAMDLVDDDLLEKASPTRRKEPQKISAKRKVTVICAACLLLVLGLWLFIPFNTSPPDVSAYEGSEYYGVIQRLNLVTYRKPANKNNFEKYVLNFFRAFGGATAEDMAEGFGSEPTSGTPLYAEVTDNQVADVIEGDRFKRSDRYIYYLNYDALQVYNVAGTESALVGSYVLSFADVGTKSGKYMLYDTWEIYLSEDCSTVTVIAPFYDKGMGGHLVHLVSLDVTDPAAIVQKARLTVSGYYLSSRKTGDEILLISGFTVGLNPDFSDPFRFIPSIDNGNGAVCLPVEDIVTPDTVRNAEYTVLCILSEEGLTLRDSTALLSYSTHAYVSATDIFITRTYTKQEKRDGKVYDTAMTEIARVAREGEELEYTGSIAVNGMVKDQYSMDVYKGILRVVTTTSTSVASKTRNGEILMTDSIADTSADLYCIDLSTFRIVSSVIGFAPLGESAEAVRFEGDKAYVCTAVVVQNTDPVFFFDLSDIHNITYKDTGEIVGYSTSLIALGNGFLLGIGIGDKQTTLKIEVYRESENGVISVCKYEMESVICSSDYKSYFIDREQGLIGLGYERVGGIGENESGYLLVQFNGSTLNKVLDVQLTGVNTHKRATLIGDCFYMLGRSGLKVEKFY